jgi:hypothetical protein
MRGVLGTTCERGATESLREFMLCLGQRLVNIGAIDAATPAIADVLAFKVDLGPGNLQANRFTSMAHGELLRSPLTAKRMSGSVLPASILIAISCVFKTP